MGRPLKPKFANLLHIFGSSPKMFLKVLGIGLFGVALVVVSVPFLPAYRIGAEPPPSDVIVALANKNRPERAAYARSLVERDVAPRMLSTLVDPECIRAGRLPQACASGVRNTVDEALLMRRVVTAEGVRRATIVTSGYHVPRATVIFRIIFLGSGIQVSVVAPPGSPRTGMLIRELWKFFPSVGVAIIGRLSPSLYRWINQHIYEDMKNGR